VKLKRIYILFVVLFGSIVGTNGQNVSLYDQFNGRYDFTFIGNTLNIQPNGANDACILLSSSDAVLNLNPDDVIVSAYLYWAGSGTGDFDVKLNEVAITSQRNFAAIQSSNGNPFFSAFADVTALLQTSGNGQYTFSDLDVTPFLNPFIYCNNGTNFAGWAIVIVFENATLPLNQLNIYDGLEALSTAQVGVQDQLVINLGNLNVLDNSGAKLGFVAWEGDANIANQESLLINGNIIDNPPLNPGNNAFNGTNNITGSNSLFNMDLDVYNIQNYVSIGNNSVEVKMTTAQDFVLINTIVSKLNSQLPDATVVINSIEQECDSRLLILNYSVSNFNATNALPPGTPISIYINDVFVAYDETTLPIEIGETVNLQTSLTVPNEFPMEFNIQIVVDDTGNGTGIVPELVENNNAFSTVVTLWVSPTFTSLENLIACNEGFTSGTFDFSAYEDAVKTNPNDNVRFYETIENAQNEVNPILNTANFVATSTPKEIFVRIDNENCFVTTSFLLTTRNCPPTVYNFISANNDAVNDTFTIDGLYDIFLNFKIEIYNRWGRLIWTGNQTTPKWDGLVKNSIGNEKAPDGTYFYLLFLNDVDYPEPLQGYIYLNH
jgi:gliding motility-associated-like protein